MNEHEATDLLDRLGRDIVVPGVDSKRVLAMGRRRRLARRGLQTTGGVAAIALVAVAGLTVQSDLRSDQVAVMRDPAPSGPSASTSVEQRLWRLADRAATRMGGQIKSAEAVRTTPKRIEQVTGVGYGPGDKPVWYVQVEGIDRFVCDSCSRPYGAKAPRGTYLILVLDADTFGNGGGGLDSKSTDLAKLGTVIHLHP